MSDDVPVITGRLDEAGRSDAYRLGREEFAECLGAAPKSVQNWETGSVAKISLFMQRALDTALERATPGQRQHYLAQVSHFGGDHSGDQEDATDRQLAPELIGSLAGGLAMSAYLESVELDRQLEASDLGPETLQQLDLAVDYLGLAYLRSAPAQTLVEARAARQRVVQLLNGRHTLAQRAQLYAIAAGLSALIGHASFDLGQDGGAVDGHCGTALHLAREIGHGELTSWVRGTQAMAATYRGRLGDAIALARAGQDAAPAGSITMYLPFYAGTCYSWLGLAEHAASRSREAIALCDSADADWPATRPQDEPRCITHPSIGRPISCRLCI